MAKTKHKYRFRLFLWINQLFVSLLLLTYLSPYIPPQIFWPFSILGLTYPFLLLINIVFIILWVLLTNKNFLYSLLAILIGLSTLNKHFRLKDPEIKTVEQGIKIVSFNVKNLSNNNIKYADINIRSSILNYLEDQNAQIICLQEFQTYPSKGINTVEEFQDRLGMPYYAKTRYVPKSKFKFVDLMLLYSKYPIISQRELRYMDKSYALIADIVYNHDTIRLFNIHLESNHFGKNEYEIFNLSDETQNEERGDQVLSLVDKLARYSKIRNIQVDHIREVIKNTSYPILICGDFNDTPATYSYQKLAKGLKDTFIEKGKGYGNTYNGKLPALRIDYILSDTLFQIHQFEIGKINLSDHYPVIGTLSLPKEK
ncbi:MAG: endonuclease/exonuclease/phosphatase family protein [Bacteroidales bacterium]|nr:endonuclease/exonuclease/phosphatase family protein [Bacteroidales bacterium]